MIIYSTKYLDNLSITILLYCNGHVCDKFLCVFLKDSATSSSAITHKQFRVWCVNLSPFHYYDICTWWNCAHKWKLTRKARILLGAWSLSGDSQFVTEHKENTCADLFLLASTASWSKPSNDHVPPFLSCQSQPLPNGVWPLSWGMIWSKYEKNFWFNQK